MPAPPITARLVKAATPATAATLTVPVRVPPELTDAVTTSVLEVLVLPAASRIATLGCVANTTPDTDADAPVSTPTLLPDPTVGTTETVALVKPDVAKVMT